jgi:hypothetical protein
MKILYNKRKRKILITIASIVIAFALAIGACAIYINDYYRTDMDAINAFMPQGTTWEEESDGTISFVPKDATKGLIFYPGGKVEYTAYVPLMQACAENGILCILLKMPFNLAVLDINAAEGMQNKYPEIEDWYIGGHSLGGSMAASYLKNNVEDYEGLVLLGSYSAADLSDTDLDVLSIFGSEDKVMNREKYEKNKSNLPKDFTEYVINGGCHSYFGMYGEQDGDGTPTITNEEQIRLTVESIVWLME